MKRVDIGMRPKRFDVLQSSQVTIVVETMTGAKITGRVTDASLKGVAALFEKADVEQHLAASIEVGEIIPESKLLWDDRECPLGRLSLIRKSEPVGDKIKVAMSCIDTRIPLTGHLARHFTEIDRGQANPLDFELNAPKFSLADFAEAEFQHPDLFERCRQYKVLLGELRKNPLFQYYSVKEADGGSRARFMVSGSRKRIDAVSFASYDYLGLYKHPSVVAAAKRAIDEFGVSSAGTLILSGKTRLHAELEYEIARWFQKEDAVIFANGFATNVGTITGILRPNDLVVADIFSHASIMDGIAASKASSRFFRHNDLKSMRAVLEKMRGDFNGALLVTEGLFSMEGTTPDMRSFVETAKAFNARTFVDECHSIGIFGPRGLGIADRDGVLEDIDLFMGSFSKGLGVGAVGFVAAQRDMTDWLRYFARAGMFSAAVPPASAGAALEVIKILRSDTSHVEALRRNVKRFRQGLHDIGLKSPADDESPIIPIIVNDSERLGRINRELIDSGVYVNCILYPAVPVDQPRFRFSLTASHSPSDIDLAINALKNAFAKHPGSGSDQEVRKAS